MFLPILVLVVFPISVIQCCEIYYATYGPYENPNTFGGYFIYLNISELGLAAVFNNYSAIPDLLTTCDVNARASFLNGQIGWFFSEVPILSLAVFGDALEIITELVEVPDIDLNAVDDAGFSPLIWSVIINNYNFGNNTFEIAETLLRSGADPNIKDHYSNQTALEITENEDVYQMLLEYGATTRECPTSNNVCKTVDGAMPFAKCVFPFTYEGNTYCGCNAYDPETVWCSTRTDEMGRHTQGFWGICSDECPIE